MMCKLYKLGKAPMCTSARVISSNTMYLSTDIDECLKTLKPSDKERLNDLGKGFNYIR